MIMQMLSGINILITISSGIFTLLMIFLRKYFHFQIYKFQIRKTSKGKLQDYLEGKKCLSIYKNVVDHKEYVFGPIFSFSNSW